MSSVQPPPPAPPPPTASPAAPAVVTIANAPEALLKLPVGAQIDVRLLQAVADGRIEADSPLGKLLLRTPLQLPEGATLSLTMAGAVRGQVSLRMTAFDGEPLSKALPELLATMRTAAGPGAADPGRTPLGAGADGTSKPSFPGQAPGGLPRPPALTAVVVRGASPVDAPPPGPHAARPAAVGPTAPTSAAGRGSPAQPPVPDGGGSRLGVPLLPTGTELAVRLTAFHPPGVRPPPSPVPQAQGGAGQQSAFQQAAPPSPREGTGAASVAPAARQQGGAQWLQPQQPPPMMLAGTVTSQGASGHALVQTQAGTLALQTRADLPVGSTVVLEVTPRAPVASGAGAQPAAPPAAGGFAGPPGPAGWPAFSDALDVLSRADPAMAQRLSAAMPQSDPNLTANVIAFMRAVRTNDSRQWMGEEPLGALEKAGAAGRKAARRIAEDIRDMGSQQRGAQTEWRSLSIPFAVGGAIERITIVTRREDGAQEEDGDRRKRREKGQRFLINLNLSRLGELQFDGLYRRSERQFDLVIRSKSPIRADMRQDIAAVFARSARVLDLKGGVGFQVTEQFAGPPPDSPGLPGAPPEGLFV